MFKPLETDLMLQMNALKGKIIDIHSIDNVFEAINTALGLSRIDLCSHRRYTDLVEARYIAYHFLHTELDLTSANICHYFKKDLTTVIHGLYTFAEFIEGDKIFQNKVNKVNKALFNNPFYEN